MQKAPIPSQEKLNSRSSTVHKSRIIDNPLFQSTVGQPWIPPQTARDTLPLDAASLMNVAQPEPKDETTGLRQEEKTVIEKIDVSQMVSDLHKQLSVTLGMKDCQEEELRHLRHKLIKAQENVSAFDAQLRQLKDMLSCQEEPVTHEAPAHIERFEVQAMTKFFKEGFALRDSEIEDLQAKVNVLEQEITGRDSRIVEMEDQNKNLADQLVDTRIELDKVTAEKEQCLEELERVKAGVAEIRALLTGRSR